MKIFIAFCAGILLVFAAIMWANRTPHTPVTHTDPTQTGPPITDKHCGNHQGFTTTSDPLKYPGC